MYLDNHDNQIYCLGKGPSATTVSAPQIVPTLGSSVMITGTATDQTASGRSNVAGSLDFTLKGTPTISDASMEAWMEHMFQQRPTPTNAIGVQISLDTIDPNGNYIHIGNVTRNITGTYGLKFTPQVSGTYQIIATLAGSNSYGPSSAQTYLAANDAVATPISTETVQANLVNIADLLSYVVVGVVAIIIAVAIIGMLILRKRT